MGLNYRGVDITAVIYNGVDITAVNSANIGETWDWVPIYYDTDFTKLSANLSNEITLTVPKLDSNYAVRISGTVYNGNTGEAYTDVMFSQIQVYKQKDTRLITISQGSISFYIDCTDYGDNYLKLYSNVGGLAAIDAGILIVEQYMPVIRNAFGKAYSLITDLLEGCTLDIKRLESPNASAPIYDEILNPISLESGNLIYFGDKLKISAQSTTSDIKAIEINNVEYPNDSIITVTENLNISVKFEEGHWQTISTEEIVFAPTSLTAKYYDISKSIPSIDINLRTRISGYGNVDKVAFENIEIFPNKQVSVVIDNSHEQYVKSFTNSQMTCYVYGFLAKKSGLTVTKIEQYISSPTSTLTKSWHTVWSGSINIKNNTTAYKTSTQSISGIIDINYPTRVSGQSYHDKVAFENVEILPNSEVEVIKDDNKSQYISGFTTSSITGKVISKQIFMEYGLTITLIEQYY